MEAAGVEPASCSTEPDSRKAVTETGPEHLAQTLARNSQIDPALARIVEAWPKLPAAIRKAMLALAESGAQV